MRRRWSDPADDPDTDVSISEDEDFHEGSSNYCVSLGRGNSQKHHQDGIQVLLQLERLRDGGIASSMTRSDIQSQAGQVKHDDDVMRFGDSGGFSLSRKDYFPCNNGDEEIASDDEDEEYARLVSSINRGECRSQKKEPEEPISEDFKDGCDALQKVQDRAEKSEKFVAKTTEYPSANELEDFDEQHGNSSVLMLPNAATFPGGHVRQSIADFLDGLQENTSLPEGNLMTGKKMKKVSSGGDIEREVADIKFLDELMPEPDPINSTSCSSGEESNHNNYDLPRSHHDRSIMTGRFQEILDSSSLANVDSLYSVEKTSSSGIFGQLQRVIQSQKDADIEFLKMMQEGGCYDNTFSDVLILSKQLDAKLTVCQCSLVGNQENPLSSQDLNANSSTRERTVIFSPRVCNGVDLEIGNLIRIYPPWLGVRLGKGHDHNQSMILCTYYAQVSASTVPEI